MTFSQLTSIFHLISKSLAICNNEFSKRSLIKKTHFGNFVEVFNYLEQLGDLIILADVFHAFLTIAAGSVSNRQLDILRVSTSLNNWQILFHNCPEIYPRAPVTLVHWVHIIFEVVLC